MKFQVKLDPEEGMTAVTQCARAFLAEHMPARSTAEPHTAPAKVSLNPPVPGASLRCIGVWSLPLPPSPALTSRPCIYERNNITDCGTICSLDEFYTAVLLGALFFVLPGRCVAGKESLAN